MRADCIKSSACMTELQRETVLQLAGAALAQRLDTALNASSSGQTKACERVSRLLINGPEDLERRYDSG